VISKRCSIKGSSVSLQTSQPACGGARWRRGAAAESARPLVSQTIRAATPREDVGSASKANSAGPGGLAYHANGGGAAVNRRLRAREQQSAGEGVAIPCCHDSGALFSIHSRRNPLLHSHRPSRVTSIDGRWWSSGSAVSPRPTPRATTGTPTSGVHTALSRSRFGNQTLISRSSEPHSMKPPFETRIAACQDRLAAAGADLTVCFPEPESDLSDWIRGITVRTAPVAVRSARGDPELVAPAMYEAELSDLPIADLHLRYWTDSDDPLEVVETVRKPIRWAAPTRRPCSSTIECGRRSRRTSENYSPTPSSGSRVPSSSRCGSARTRLNSRRSAGPANSRIAFRSKFASAVTNCLG